jgi:hypothetical protein
VVLALVVATLVGLLVPPGLLGGSVGLLTGSLLSGWALLVAHERRPRALGFYVASDAVRDALKGVGVGTVLALVVVAAIAAAGGLGWTAEAGSAGAWVREGARGAAVLALPAAAEEAFMRGYPLQALAHAWGPVAGLVVTSAAFGAMHLSNPEVTALAALNVAAAGAFLGVVYLRTGSLWWATGAHLGWNWSHGFLADVPVSGLEVIDAPLYEGHARGPEWLGGGGFGPEGSLVATFVVHAATVVCWRAPWLAASPAALAADPLVVVGGPSSRSTP